MLLEFKVSNYKTFAEETIFNMSAVDKHTDLDYSILHQKVKGKTVEGLSASVIYGMNATGKTNLIGAMDVFKAIVLRGNLENKKAESDNKAVEFLELIPNNLLKETKPVQFGIKFFEQGMLIEYSIAIDLGQFLDEYYNRKVLEEKLVVNDKVIFERTDGVTLYTENLKVLEVYGLPNLDQKLEVFHLLSQDTADTDLFLTGVFRTLLYRNFVDIVLEWFKSKLTIVYRTDKVCENIAGGGNQEILDKAIKLFEGGKNFPIQNRRNLHRRIHYKLLLENSESSGTRRFKNILPLLIETFITGGILVIDDFDVSIHPMALINIINIFHNDDINKRQAQIIFTAHNPVFLNSNLFRRDEIKFVEQDEVGCSRLYDLTDFKENLQKNEDYMHNYLAGKYGAIQDVDFSSIFEEINEMLAKNKTDFSNKKVSERPDTVLLLTEPLEDNYTEEEIRIAKEKLKHLFEAFEGQQNKWT